MPAGVTETDKAIQSTEQWNRRILANAVVCSRVRELHSAAIALEISSRNSRVAALQKRWDRSRAGQLCPRPTRRGHGRFARRRLVRDYRGKDADRLVTRIDPGVVSLSPNCAATSGRPPRKRDSEDPCRATRSSRRSKSVGIACASAWI